MIKRFDERASTRVLSDEELRALRFVDEAGATVATLINWSTHPESLEDENTEVSSDFIHYIRAAVERELGGTAVYFTGDLGAVEIVAGLAPSYAAFALLTPLLGLSALTMITAANAFMQLHTDAGMRGRVMALYMMIFMGGTPAGAPVVGWVGEEFGARMTLIGGGAMTILGVVLAAGVFLGRDRRRRQAGSETPVEAEIQAGTGVLTASG